MELNKLLQPWISIESTLLIKGLANDSRKVRPGDLFVAYPGAVSDGRKFIDMALANGAVAILYEPEGWQPPGSLACPCIALPQLAVQLGELASRFYDNPARKMSVTGVTGTNGKTTIAYQLSQAHSLLGNPAIYIGTLGYGASASLKPLANTTPDALFLQKILDDYHKEGIGQVSMEVSSHALSQNRVDNILFKHAIFTNLTQDHLDYHQTMANYAAAKAKLFAYKGLQTAIVNQDDPYMAIMVANLPQDCQLLTYGFNEASSVRVLDYHSDLHGTQISVTSPWGRQELSIKALGIFNIYNTLAIYTSLVAHGYGQEQVVRVLAQLKSAPGRMEIVHQQPSIIVDYAHTPDALDNVLKTLSPLKKGRLIVVFGCGGDRDKGKRPLMGKIAEQYADLAIITNDNPRSEDPQQIIADIRAGMLNKSKALIIPDRKEAIAQAIALAEPEDVIVIAGKGHENYQQIGETRFHFSDQEVVRSLLGAVDISYLESKNI